MNGIDILLIFLVLLGTANGYRRGFIMEGLHLAGWALSLWLAYIFHDELGSFFSEAFPSIGEWSLPLSFISILIFTRFFFYLLSTWVFSRTSINTHQSNLNRIAGLIPGAINGVILAIIVSAVLLTMPFSDTFNKAAHGSRLANNLVSEVAWIDEKLAPIFDDALNASINKRIIHEPDKIVPLKFRVTNPKTREDLELKMLEMINGERRVAGLPPLVADPQLTLVAREHSHDMFVRSYFSHMSPDGSTPSDRIRKANIRFMTAGENLALAPTLSLAHKGLMNSPGHKANILHKSYGRVGIGVLDGGAYGLMVTQNFRN
jgi:uncharacterized protein YkwD/uncharacterized membrane protein required for colicin V production